MEGIIAKYKPITLEEMSGIKLMNRIDTKYVVTEAQLREILKRVREAYYAQEAENNRFSPYRTVYYDTPELAMYIAHHNRRLVRDKVRVRTYVDSNLPFCEVKHKNNKGRTNKERIKMERMDNIVENPQTAAFLAEKQPYEVCSLSPQLETAFKRVTLVNFEKTERLTIDCDLTFTDMVNGKAAKMAPLVVMELKQDGRAHSLLKDVLFDMRIKPFKISKYCIGRVLCMQDGIKNNLFKEKLLAYCVYLKKHRLTAAGGDGCKVQPALAVAYKRNAHTDPVLPEVAVTLVHAHRAVDLAHSNVAAVLIRCRNARFLNGVFNIAPDGEKIARELAVYHCHK